MVGIAIKVISESKLCVVNVTLVMTDCPFGGFLNPDGICPAEPHDTGTDRDTKSPGFRFDTAAPTTTGPRWCGFEQRRCRRDQLGAREPQPQCVDRPQLPGREPVGNRVADIFGTYNKPASPWPV